jgi:hypothetical protein
VKGCAHRTFRNVYYAARGGNWLPKVGLSGERPYLGSYSWDVEAGALADLALIWRHVHLHGGKLTSIYLFL